MDTKSKIIEGAAELFRKYGIKSVTMDIIATNLGISKRTIYEYFSDKDELLIGVFENMSKKQKEVVSQIINESENIISAIFKLIHITLDHFYNMSPGFIEDIKKIHRELIIKKKIKFEIPDFKNNQQLIDRGIKEKLFRRNINADIVNRTIYFMMLWVMKDELYPYEEFSRREVMKNTIINYLKGIATPDGLKLIEKQEKKLFTGRRTIKTMKYA